MLNSTLTSGIVNGTTKLLASTISNRLFYYPTPSQLNYNWSFGSLVGLFFALQIVTGIILAMHYTPHIDYAFASVEHIMTDVHGGYLFRYFHANGASVVFILSFSTGFIYLLQQKKQVKVLTILHSCICNNPRKIFTLLSAPIPVIPTPPADPIFGIYVLGGLALTALGIWGANWVYTYVNVEFQKNIVASHISPLSKEERLIAYEKILDNLTNKWHMYESRDLLEKILIKKDAEFLYNKTYESLLVSAQGNSLYREELEQNLNKI